MNPDPMAKVRKALRRVEQALGSPESVTPTATNGTKVELDALTKRVRKTCQMTIATFTEPALEDEPTVIMVRSTR